MGCSSSTPPGTSAAPEKRPDEAGKATAAPQEPAATDNSGAPTAAAAPEPAPVAVNAGAPVAVVAAADQAPAPAERRVQLRGKQVVGIITPSGSVFKLSAIPAYTSSGKHLAVLRERGVHAYFLFYLMRYKFVLEDESTVDFSDTKIWELVESFVKPITAGLEMGFVEAVMAESLPPELEFKAMDTDGKHPALLGDRCYGRDAKLHHFSGWGFNEAEFSDPFFGPANFFVSHAWSYPLRTLVAMIEHHYRQHDGCNWYAGLQWSPFFYWVDIFAVDENFKGDFGKHPDSDFRSVVKGAEELVFTLYPWNAPTPLSRVWCLFEAMCCVEEDVVMKLVPEPDVYKVFDTKSGDELTKYETDIRGLIDEVDVVKAQATVAADKTFIMGLIESGIGVDNFNKILRGKVEGNMLQLFLHLAVFHVRDVAVAVDLVRRGAKFEAKNMDLFDKSLGDNGVEALAGVVANGGAPHLTTLYLQKNNVHSSGAIAIADAMVNNNTILEFGLMMNPDVGEDAMVATFEKLVANHTIREIQVSSDHFGDAAFAALAGYIKSRKPGFKRVTIAVGVKPIDASVRGLMADAIASSHIEILALTNSDKGKAPAAGTDIGWDAVMGGVAEALHHNPQLTKLVIRHLGLTDAALSELAAALATNTKLSIVEIPGNNITGEGAAKLVQAAVAAKANGAAIATLDLTGSAGISAESKTELAQLTAGVDGLTVKL